MSFNILLRIRIFHAIKMTSYFIQVYPFRLEFIFMLLVLFSEFIVVSVVIESVSPEFFTILWGLSRRKTSDRALNSLHK